VRIWASVAIRVGAVLCPLALAACQSVTRPHPSDGCEPAGAGPDGPPGELCRDHAKVCKNPSMMALGHDLDHLERHIEWFGSVVPKVPDVWGQARLTRHREEFEAEMATNMKLFDETLQGSLARTDQSYFLQAVALSTAAAGSTPGSATVTAIGAIAPEGEASPEAAKDPIAGFFAKPRSFMPGNFATSVPTQDKDGNTVRTLGVALEPSLVLAQKKRYLDFLNQVRRENEGDDTGDSPGYSPVLLRIPVSVLPGKKTEDGYGAEITMTVNPVLSDELLPMTFRNLVTNDLLHQLGFPLTQLLDNPTSKGRLEPLDRDLIIMLPVINEISDLVRRYANKTNDEQLQAVCDIRAVVRGLIAPDLDRLRALAKGESPDSELLLTAILDTTKTSADVLPLIFSRADGKTNRTYQARVEARTDLGSKAAALAAYKLSIPPLSFSPGIGSKTGFPTSQLVDVYGLSNCFQIAFAANNALRDSIDRQKYAHLPDVQGFLQQETAAAYRFLAEPECHALWERYCTPELVTAIRTRKVEQLQTYREEFRKAVEVLTQTGREVRTRKPFIEPGQYGTTAALAWCIVVDSALLNDRLVRDMREASSAKGRPLPGCGDWLPYFLPCPPDEARKAFNAYVALRWPVRVFALDPYTQDQNLADSLLTRRETQLALSMAFASGKINANTLTRYARRLEAEYETIALNRTQVGFGHGENVFGWRFYPRFQTPDTEGNLKVLVRDQLIGGPNRDQLLRQRRLEPGPRECVAVVLMPAFVPYATLDTTSNWFALANPKHKTLDHTQALKMSRTVQTLKSCGPNVGDAGCYRDGEFGRLLGRIGQLESRLPTQTLVTPVPILNTLGGFEMFSNGTTDLAPELYGFYGAPGVSAEGESTLFLVGDHFSTLHTRVIVGNREVAVGGTTDAVVKQRMLSRQVMQVTVSAAGPYVTKDGRPHVAAHVATPYGVTRELLIPVVAKPVAAPPAPAEGYKLGAEKLTLPYCKSPAGDGKFHLGLQNPLPKSKSVDIVWSDALGAAPPEVKVTLHFEYKGCPFAHEVPGAIKAAENKYTLTSAHLDAVLGDLFGRLNRFDRYTDDTNPLQAGVEVKKVTVKPVEGDPRARAAVETQVGGKLMLVFECSICDDKAAVPGIKAPKLVPPGQEPAAPEPAPGPRVQAPETPVGVLPDPRTLPQLERVR
jgi:hypothetical protein